MGSSLLALFVAAGFDGVLGFWTILLAHIMFCVSFVVVTVKARTLMFVVALAVVAGAEVVRRRRAAS